MDNRVFNVNGDGKEMLEATLMLAFQQAGHKSKAVSWRVTKKGLILRWFRVNPESDGGGNFLTPLKPKAAADLVWEWLQSEEGNPEHFEMTDWDADEDHDGSNSLGWRVYVDGWGHVSDDFYTICAIKPAYLWHGK